MNINKMIVLGKQPKDRYTTNKHENEMDKNINELENNIRKYNLDPVILEPVPNENKCDKCNRVVTNRDWIFYVLENNNLLRVGSECVKEYFGVKVCGCCNSEYDGWRKNCPKCKSKRVTIPHIGDDLTFGGIINKVKKSLRDAETDYFNFLIAYISGNENTDFYKYAISSGEFKKPPIQYDYIKSGRYINCSVFHIFLLHSGDYMINNWKFEETGLDKNNVENIRNNIYHKCSICDDLYFHFDYNRLMFTKNKNCPNCDNKILDKFYIGKTYRELLNLYEFESNTNVGYDVCINVLENYYNDLNTDLYKYLRLNVKFEYKNIFKKKEIMKYLKFSKNQECKNLYKNIMNDISTIIVDMGKYKEYGMTIYEIYNSIRTSKNYNYINWIRKNINRGLLLTLAKYCDYSNNRFDEIYL